MYDLKYPTCKWNMKMEREHADYCIKQVEYDEE
jgi:hypothetical protein